MSTTIRFLQASTRLLFSTIVILILLVAGVFFYLSAQLPPVETLRDVQLQTPSRIYSADGLLMGEFGEQRRIPIEFYQVPPLFIQAILAAEDDRFFNHHGVDIKGLLRAALQLVTTGKIQTGGSTITMQVAKNYFLTREKTFARKFNEIILALQIERELPKQAILELYLNKIFLGNRAYGIEAAAHVYYGASIEELSLAQWAMIAGLPKAPSANNPLVNPDRALIRRNWILGRMLDLGYIDKHSFDKAINSPITARYHGASLELSAPYVAEMARQALFDRYGKTAYTDGYQVHTTIHSSLQIAAQQAVRDGLLAYDARHGYREPTRQYHSKPYHTESSHDNRESWLSQLAQTPTFGGLIPAVVSDMDDQTITAWLADGSAIIIDWQQNRSAMRPYLTVNQRGRTPSTPQEILAVGDLIRVAMGQEGEWLITQLPAAQAALVSLRADNGAILSLVGGFDYQHSQFNRATQAERQPGSSFKPFIYTAALANGYTAATVINDAPLVFNDPGAETIWRPGNNSGQFFGPTRLREALYKSRNLVSVRVLRGVGIAKTIDYLQNFGFTADRLPNNLSLALGSTTMTPLEAVTAYAIFANGGYRIEPYLIDRIEAIDGTIVYQAQVPIVCPECVAPLNSVTPLHAASPHTTTLPHANDQTLSVTHPPPDELSLTDEAMATQTLTDEATATQPLYAEPVIDARLAYITDSFLKDVVKKGTGRRARSLGRSDVAGKTGTTNGPVDLWFSGYAGGIVTSVWLGFDDNRLLGRNEYGSSAALPIWIQYMEVALKNRPETIRQQPEGIISVKIDPATGLLAAPGQLNTTFEIFRAEHIPQQSASQSSSTRENHVPVEEIF